VSLNFGISRLRNCNCSRHLRAKGRFWANLASTLDALAVVAEHKMSWRMRRFQTGDSHLIATRLAKNFEAACIVSGFSKYLAMNATSSPWKVRGKSLKKSRQALTVSACQKISSFDANNHGIRAIAALGIRPMNRTASEEIPRSPRRVNGSFRFAKAADPRTDRTYHSRKIRGVSLGHDFHALGTMPCPMSALS
jgi:hypothetical protein